MKILKRVFSLLLAVCLLSAFAACADPAEPGPTPTPQPEEKTYSFDYVHTDMTQYVGFPVTAYRDLTFTTAPCATVTDADVKATFNGYFADEDQTFYLPVAEENKAIAQGDYLYLRYCGVTKTVLEKAVTDGKITGVDAPGLSYDEIVALKLGFQGGTTSGIIPIKIGSAGYIDGFESGLVGLVPAEHGAAAPYPLHVTFPANYGNEELKGQPATFFCDLVYIGDGQNPYTWDTMTVDLVNRFLGLSGENAYTSMQACYDKIKDGMESDARKSFEEARLSAMWEKIVAAAAFTSVPTDAVGAYLQQWLASKLDEANYYYYNYPSYYQYMYATNMEPTADIILRCMDETMNSQNYVQKLTAVATPAVKQEMVYYYILQTEAVTLTEEEYNTRRAGYLEKYGPTIFNGVDDSVVRDQFLYDKICESLITGYEEGGKITYAADAEG